MLTVIDPLRHDNSSVRRVAVTPSMCGHNSLFASRIGDWTWEAVAQACDIDVLRARDPTGDPTYLSFYYFRIVGGPQLHPLGLTFGDNLTVRSEVFDYASESVLTLHRITRTDGSNDDDGPLDLDEFYAQQRPDCLYIENLNRWVSRSTAGSNSSLHRASPLGFNRHRLPRAPSQYSPRGICGTARRSASLTQGQLADRHQVGDVLEIPYRIDPSRDINGVGLVYFASYFSFVNTAALAAWRALGRTDTAFLRRRIVDNQLCFFGNTEIGTELLFVVTTYADRTNPRDEFLDVAVRERDTGRLLAVGAIRQLWD